MTNQRWKSDPNLYNCPTKKNGLQTKKIMDYDTTYRKEFLDCDPLRDWESVERCKWLWEWSLELIPANDLQKLHTDWLVLDVGTKDACFPEWLREQGIMSIGLEYSEPYVRYAINLGRPVKYGNACAMELDDNTFNYVFAHHLHGLLPDYMKGLQEMFRVTNKYMIALNQVPGNKRKHYSYIDSPEIYFKFIEWIDDQSDVYNVDIIYNDYLETGFGDEWVILLKKNLPEGFFHGPGLPKPDFNVTDKEYEEIEFKKKKKDVEKFF